MRRIAILIIVISMLATACGASTGTTGSTTPRLYGATLYTVGNCDELLSYYVDHAVDLVGPYGLPGQYHGGPVLEYWAEDAVRAPATTVPASAQVAGSNDYSGTNVQVAGVDEADIVKTDGERIFMIVDGTLRIALVEPGGVTMAGTLQLNDWWPSQMLLSGDRVLLIGASWNNTPVPYGVVDSYGSSAITRIVQVDVSDPNSPVIEKTLLLDGSYVDSRLVDGVARVAINSNPVGFDWAYPEGSGLRAEQQATQKNRDIVKASTLDNWLPYFVLTDEKTGRTSEGQLLDCSAVMAPNDFAGLDTLSILTFDLNAGIDDWASAGVVASGSTMYATADHVYIATQRWVDWSVLADSDARSEADGYHTQIHVFDTTKTGSPQYVGGGEVKGFLLNQFSMDEYDGVLRVASTTAPSGWWWSDDSESLVSTLRLDNGELKEIGQVDGLGQGEQIYSVRFIEDAGYVVTFRQTDPLYVIDLADATDPHVAGELKILGYSAYLHPVGDGLLLGVGQDANDEGRTSGTQFSLFDVSDPENPTRIDQVAMDGGYSSAEYDHHAFTYWNGLVLTPYSSWTENKVESGVIAIRVDDRTLSFEGLLQQEQKEPDALRTIVIGDTIYTISYRGIGMNDLNSLESLGFVSF
jgi:uncharacterized secreted protein with C-terminal beta-propeller domain